MKITFFIGTLSGGGAERVVANLSNYLSRKGYEITILNFRDNESVYALDDSVKRKYLLGSQWKKNIMTKGILYLFEKQIMRRSMIKFVKQNECDCYVVLLEDPTILLLSVKDKINCPVLVSERNYPGIYPEKYQDKLKALSVKGDGYVFQTSKAKEWYEENVKKSIIIPNAVNEEFLNLEMYKLQRRKAIVSVGRLTKEKNQKLLIKSFEKLQEKYPEYILELYGVGPLEEELKQYVLKHNLSRKVIFKGFSKRIKDEIYNASLFVLPSDTEGLPNALIEAMAMGLPCISTDFAGGGAHTLIDNGVSGLIVNPNNIEELSAAIDNVLKDKNFANSLSRKAMEKVKEFSPEKIYSSWEEFILEICQSIC